MTYDRSMGGFRFHLDDPGTAAESSMKLLVLLV